MSREQAQLLAERSVGSKSRWWTDSIGCANRRPARICRV
jgi:hypothetical protein